MEFFDVSSEKEMDALGRAIARRFAAQGSARPRAFLLKGPLGAGKSVFARGFIRFFQMEGNGDIPSPTFTLVQYYGSASGPIHHFDLYRLSAPEDVFELGWEEALSEGLTLIEWPEKAGPYLPPDPVTIEIAVTGENARHVTLYDPRLPALPGEAFILAAGKGTRLRPHTDHMPKPMVPVGGESIIRRSIKKLAQAGVHKIIINLHHLSAVLRDHLYDISNPEIIFSEEAELLETAGGIKSALQHFSGAFFIINGDALWEDGPLPALTRLGGAWDDSRMDILLLLHPVSSMRLTGGSGDYNIDANGLARRAAGKDGAYMFAGIRIAHPRIFKDAPDGAFSFLSLMDEAERKGRLYAIIHDGEWHHISTPSDLTAVNAHYERAGL